MKKIDTIRAVAEKASITHKAAGDLLEALASCAGEELAKTGEFTLPGIVKITVVKRPERQGRNPRTGQAATIAASNGIKFKAFTALKEAVK